MPGTVSEAEVENENGAVVWEVKITDADGVSHEVAVDAGNGAVLATDVVDDGEDPEEGEAAEGPEEEHAEGPEENEVEEPAASE